MIISRPVDGPSDIFYNRLIFGSSEGTAPPRAPFFYDKIFDTMSTRHILIVDDLHDIRQLLRSSLETLKLDINIIDVPSGEEAMLVIARRKYDLLVSDVRLAGISGLDLVRRVPEMRGELSWFRYRSTARTAGGSARTRPPID
jgi:CheY-like chemotaxis protein